MLAPSAMNLRPYEFVVRKDPGKYEAAKVRYL
jgi:nitroreductase